MSLLPTCHAASFQSTRHWPRGAAHCANDLIQNDSQLCLDVCPRRCIAAIGVAKSEAISFQRTQSWWRGRSGAAFPSQARSLSSHRRARLHTLHNTSPPFFSLPPRPRQPYALHRHGTAIPASPRGSNRECVAEQAFAAMKGAKRGKREEEGGRVDPKPNSRLAKGRSGGRLGLEKKGTQMLASGPGYMGWLEPR